MGTIPCTWKASKVEVNSSPVEGEATENERGILNNNMVGEGSENEKNSIFYKTCETRITSCPKVMCELYCHETKSLQLWLSLWGSRFCTSMYEMSFFLHLHR